MTNNEYNYFLKLASKYIKSGRDYYKEITPEQLVTETLIYIADNKKEEILTKDLFWKYIIKVRSKMVKEILTQNPGLRNKHNYLANRWYNENKEIVAKNRKLKYKIKRGDINIKAGAPKGIKHGKFKGLIITPFGEFESSYEAARIIGVSHRCIQYRCKQENFPEYYIKDKVNNYDTKTN